MTGAIAGALVAFVLALAFTEACKRVARRAGAVAAPRQDRWHRGAVPMLGGPAIMAAVGLTAVVLPLPGQAGWLLLGAALTLGAVGLVDDLRPLKPQTKFVAQILVAAVLVVLGLQLRLTGAPVLDILITLLWFVGITNAFNLLDNMDGLAAGVAAIAVAFRFAFSVADGNVEGAVFSAIIGGAALGFLVHNFNPASIFMGDAGSLFLGLSVAGVSLVGGFPYSRSTASVLLFPVLLALVPIFDTTFVTLARLLARRPISMGGRDHTSHRLVALGLSERQAVLLLYLVSALAGAIAVFAYRYGLSVAVLFIALLALGLLIFGRFLFRLAVYPDAAPTTEAPGLLRQVADFTYTRQIGIVLIDLVLIVLAYHAAYLLRFEERYELELAKFLESLPIVLAVQLFALALLRTYQGVWRYTGLTDVIRLAQAVALGTAGSVVVLVFLYRFEGYSRTVFVLDGLVLIVLLAGSRLALRALDELLRPVPAHFRRALIYGAGDGGVLALREIRNNAALELTPVGFLDDDRSKHRSSILGTPVLGGIDRLEEVIARHQVSDVIIASTKIDPATVDRVARACDPLGVRVSRATLTLH